ncbi:MAG: hypothetical protein WC728_02180 [Elusimicrobiota bacterium]
MLDAVGLSTLEFLLSRRTTPLRLPNLCRLGLANLLSPTAAEKLGKRRSGANASRVEQASASADSVIGHREMVGVLDGRTFSLFPDGFSAEYIRRLEERIGRKTLFNKMAGGMDAIERNAAEHSRTGRPVVYSSKCDPVIQLAMDEAVIPVPEQHRIADAALALALEMSVPMTRAIGRAYVRSPEGELVRTANRHDAVLPLGSKTLVDILFERDVWTVAVGKTSELVNTRYHEKIKLTSKAFLDPGLGLRFVHPKAKDTNPFSVQGVVNALDAARSVFRPKGTFIFANLVDTDSLYGHTRDVDGALTCLAETDRILPLIERRMRRGDLLLITADHGMLHREDYGYHNKEPLFLLAEHVGSRGLGLKPPSGRTLADVGFLTAQMFGLEKEFVRTASLERFYP